MGAYDIAEHDHQELQRRRTDVEALAAYLAERNILFAVNHLFSGLTGARHEADFELFHDLVPALEILNGQVMPQCNRAARKRASLWGKARLAGSDSHSMGSLGLTFTEVPGASSQAEYLDGLKQRLGRPRGRSGGYKQLTSAVLSIAANMIRRNLWTWPAAPLVTGVPLITLGCCVRDVLFAERWSRRLCPDGLVRCSLRPREEEL